MKTGVWIVVLFASSLFFARADDESAALEKLRGIPPAPANIIKWDQSKMNPMLVLTVRGAFINHSKTPVPFDQVLKALAELPREAWPNGRGILYFPNPIPPIDPGDEPRPSDVKKVETDMKTAGITLMQGAVD